MAAAVTSIFVVAACGSGGAPASAPAATTAGGGPTTVPAATTAGGGPTTAPAATHADPCTLLTQADIKTATGSDYGVGVPDSYGHCRWFFGNSTVDEGKGMVAVYFAAAGTTLDSVKSGTPSAGVDLTVSGHPAYWDGISFGPSIWVDLGTSILVVGLDPLPLGGQAMVQRMAELAVARLE